ncbi:MAG: proline dehydrogenase family protein [Oligoflexia bacterium]|nr:proline dehydrogenase family protein [Oligoflexia bacterium]
MLNSLIVKALPIVPKPVVHWAAKKYVAGATLEDAVQAVRALNDAGATATMDLLGEFVTKRQQAEHCTQVSDQILDAIARNGLRSGLSVKLTSLGFDIDDAFCFENVRALIVKAKALNLFVRLDMENSPYTTRTLDLYRKLRAQGHDNTGVVIQAYMRRSEQDLRDLAPLQASVRLCKGIYREDASIAFKDREEIRENYKRLLAQLFESGMHAAIATHDDPLIDFARDYITRNGIAKDRYEFQMLLGVRENKRDELVREGHKVRVYVPFGNDWYNYSIRRLKENPEVAGHIMKAFLLRE